MKRYASFIFAILFIPATFCFSQESLVKFSNHSMNKIPVVKASINLSEEHEPAFWPLYEQFNVKQHNTFECSYVVLNSLSGIREADDSEAEVCADALFQRYHNALALRREYFEEITSKTNGIVGLQFLQTEELYDLMLKSELYDQTINTNAIKQMRDVAAQGKDKEMKQLLAETLQLENSEGEIFWNLLELYAFENDRIAGDAFSLYALYLQDIGDLTPAQAKRLGKEFLSMQERIIRLKEKYFKEINKAMGSNLAGRFIVLDDYLSTAKKMEAFKIH